MRQSLSVVSGGPRTAAERLAADNVGLAWRVARSMFAGATHTPEDREDALAVAALALWEAATKFDPARGFAFSTFATAYVRGRLLQHLRSRRMAARLPTLPMDAVTDFSGDRPDSRGERALRAVEDADFLRDALAGADESTVRVMRRVACDGVTQRAAAQDEGLLVQTARQRMVVASRAARHRADLLALRERTGPRTAA